MTESIDKMIQDKVEKQVIKQIKNLLRPKDVEGKKLIKEDMILFNGQFIRMDSVVAVHIHKVGGNERDCYIDAITNCGHTFIGNKKSFSEALDLAQEFVNECNLTVKIHSTGEEAK